MTDMDREALEYAAAYYGVPLDEPGVSDRLRRTSAYAWKRFGLALQHLARTVFAPLRRSQGPDE